MSFAGMSAIVCRPRTAQATVTAHSPTMRAPILRFWPVTLEAINSRKLASAKLSPPGLPCRAAGTGPPRRAAGLCEFQYFQWESTWRNADTFSRPLATAYVKSAQSP